MSIALAMGLPIEKVTFRAKLDSGETAATKGDVLAVDLNLAGSNGDATTGPPGTKTSGWAHVRAVDATDLDTVIPLCVALEDVALGEVGHFGLRGHFDILHAGGTTAIGTAYGLDGTTPAAQIDSGGAPDAGDRYFAIATEATATTNLATMYFDGWGIGEAGV